MLHTGHVVPANLAPPMLRLDSFHCLCVAQDVLLCILGCFDHDSASVYQVPHMFPCFTLAIVYGRLPSTRCSLAAHRLTPAKLSHLADYVTAARLMDTASQAQVASSLLMIGARPNERWVQALEVGLDLNN